MTIHKVLHNNVIWPFREILRSYCLNLHSEVKIGQVLEGNRWHSDLIFLGWDFDHRRILINLKQFLHTNNFRHFTIDNNRQEERLTIFQLYLQTSTNLIILFNWWYFHSNLNLRSFLSSDLKPDLFKIFISFITSY